MEHEEYDYLKHFRPHFFNAKNEEIANDAGIFSIEFPRYQDVIDLVAYVETEEGLKLAIVKNTRPALAHRQALTQLGDVPNAKDESELLEVLGGYIRPEEGESGIEVTAAQVIERKLPTAKMVGQLEILGGCYFPSVGTSTELVYPRAVRVEFADAIPESCELVTPQDIVNGYFRGIYRSCRLVELAFRFAHVHSIELSSPVVLPQGTTDQSTPDRVVSLTEARNLLSTLDAHKATITHVEVEEVETPENPFLKLSKEEINGKLYDLVIRRGVDSADIGCYVRTPDTVYIGIKCGVRPSLAVRNLAAHPLHTDTSPLLIEGIAGSLDAHESFPDEIEEHAKREVREELGVEPTQVTYIAYDYASPGRNPERTYRFVAEVDPSHRVEAHQTVDETVGAWFIELNDLLTLGDEGTIRDPRLLLNARLIALMLSYRPRTELGVPRELLQEYDKIINHGSDIQAWLSKVAREVDNRLNRSVYYRRLKSYSENELGIVALTFTHPAESHFFSAMIPVFAVFEAAAEKLPFLFLHDLFHYATWGFVPLKEVAKDGTPVLHPFETYMQAIGGNECHAVWYSDVVMPKEFGVEDAERIFHGHSVASAFAAYGFNDEEARKLIREMEVYGKIPEVLLESSLFETYRGVFIGRILRYYVLDHKNTKDVYDYWVMHPYVLKVAARFCNAFTDLAQYESHYLKTLDIISHYTEGLNPLRAYLSRVLNVEINLEALRLAVLYERIQSKFENDVRLQEVEEMISVLENVKHEIETVRSQINDIERSPAHINVLARINELRAGEFANAKQLSSRIMSDPELYTEEERTELATRILPYFEPFRVPEKDFVDAELLRIEKEQRAKLS